MRRLWQRLLLLTIILSCGIIFSLGSSTRDAASKEGQGTALDLKEERAQTSPPKVVVYYAQDRHGPW